MARSSALVAGLLVAVAVAGTTTLFAASIAMPRPAGDGAARIEAVRIDGAARGDSAGFALSGAGDVDGDGTPDVIVGAFAATADGKAFAGETYVVMGRTIRAAFRGTAGEGIDLRGMGPGEGVRILGREPHDRSGVAVSAAGDMDGDGLGEILVGAHFAGRADGDRLAGETVVLFGRTLARAAARPGSTIRLDALEAREGVTIVGPPGGNRSGWSVADAGDVDRRRPRRRQSSAAHCANGCADLPFVVSARRSPGRRRIGRDRPRALPSRGTSVGPREAARKDD